MTVEAGPKPRIAIALSGGGVRAVVFHLGVLSRLAAASLLEHVTFVSTVSGGSIAAGLTFALSGNKWPSSETYGTEIAPKARRLLTESSLQGAYVRRSITRPWKLWSGGSAILAERIEAMFGVQGTLTDLPEKPRWIINATTYETGKNWRFMPQRMGDYVLGYVINPEFPIAASVAASAAYPGLIGPLRLDTKRFEWSNYEGEELVVTGKPPKRIHLWDGGTYDNLGIEALFKQGREQRYRDGFDFLIVSDASRVLPEASRAPQQRPRRLIEIPMDQVRSLRSRSLVDHFEREPGSGIYLRIGRSTSFILAAANKTSDLNDSLDDRVVAALGALPTHLKRLKPTEFDNLHRHGWEVADSTAQAYAPGVLSHAAWTPVD